MAVLTGVESSVRLHIDRGDNLNSRDDKGLTPLMIAASRNKAVICKLLLDGSADPRLVDAAGRDALALAKAAGATEAAKVIELALEPSPPPAPAIAPQKYTEPTSANSALIHNEPIQSLPNVESTTEDAWDELDAPFDLSGWVEEVERAPPIGDASLALPAIAIHGAISEHAPIDSSADWEEFEAFLPSFAAPLLRVENLEKRDRLRSLLLRAMREGSVPAQAVEDLCVNDDQRRNAETEFSLVQAPRARMTCITSLSQFSEERGHHAKASTIFQSHSASPSLS
ncbi:ankyrin repeat domain-containing protein [Polaromonas sp.]|uniref:ankyrin repeat domain-containing protein n=1 Tax=Polaromonas sp. TaxID=1869339 RepID=UPI00356ABE52